MTSLEKLEQLEEQLRALLAEREELKNRLEQIEAAGARKKTEAESGETQQAYDLLMKEREAIRDRVESMLATISQLSKVS